MIFVFKQGNYIYITNEKRDLDSDKYSEDSELLLTLDWTEDDMKVLLESLRPFLDLLSGEERKFKYCDDVLSIIESHPKSPSRQYFAYKKDVEEAMKELEETVTTLKNFELLGKNFTINFTTTDILEKVTFKCDIFNLMSLMIDDKSYKIIEAFMNLKKKEKDLILNFYNKTSRQAKIEALRDIVALDIDRLLPFIPRWYRTNLRLFGIEFQPSFDRFKFADCPEYKNEERIDGNSIVLENQEYYIRKEVYREFHLDEVWKGKDIKAKFGEIYEKLKTPKNSRVHDIFNYFETAITRNGYKLLSRKII